MRLIKASAITCLLLTASGCSSIMSHTGAVQGYYAGTRADVAMIKDQNTSWPIISVLALDLPFSAIMDTLFLPYDYFHINNKTKSLKTRVQEAESTTTETEVNELLVSSKCE